jgi:hypothetical protein
MRTSAFLIFALVLTSVLSATTHVVMTETQIIESATQNSIDELQRLREKLERAIREGADVDVQIDFKKQVKPQKVEVKDRQTRIKDKLKLASCQRKIEKIETKIQKEKAADKPNEAKIARMNKRREWYITKQENIRIKEEKRLQKRVEVYKKDMTKIEDKVKYCELHPKARGCDYFLERYRRDANVVLQAKTNERKIEAQIVKSRKDHVNTFKNNDNIEAKKAIIVHRYNLKAQRAERRIERLEKRLSELSTREDSRRLRTREKRITERVDRLKAQIKKLRLEQQKTLAVRSTGPGACSTCDLKILELLNKIYSVVVVTPSPVVQRPTNNARPDSFADKPVYQRPAFVIRNPSASVDQRPVAPSRPVIVVRPVASAPRPRPVYNRQVAPAPRPVVRPVEPEYEYVNVRRTRRVKRVRKVARPHSWTTNEKRVVKKRVLRNNRVARYRTVKSTEYVTRPKVWYTDEKVTQTHYKWVDHKVLKTKQRSVTKRQDFQDWKWVQEKVLLNKPRKFRNQELIEVAPGKFEWKDLGFETRMVPVWETQRRYVKFTNHRNIQVQEPYQVWETEKKWTPYTVQAVIRKRHESTQRVPVSKDVQVKEWVNEPKYVDENVTENYVKTLHGTKMVDEHYDDNENYNERVRVRRSSAVRVDYRRDERRA